MGAPDQRSAINHNLCEDISLRYAKTNQAHVHLEKQAGFHLITMLLAIAKK